MVICREVRRQVTEVRLIADPLEQMALREADRRSLGDLSPTLRFAGRLDEAWANSQAATGSAPGWKGIGSPGRSRTCDLLINSESPEQPERYPDELRPREPESWP
jgi:hypothetical protein